MILTKISTECLIFIVICCFIFLAVLTILTIKQKIKQTELDRRRAFIQGAHDKPRRRKSRSYGNQSNLRIKDLQKQPRTKSEEGVIKQLELITGKKFPTVYPKWLVWKGKTLELDGYNEEMAIALEFSGPLHTKWYPEREPYTKYFERIVRDVVKKRLCKKHGVSLIVVDMSLPAIHWKEYLRSRLFDLGFIKEKPLLYILEQTAEPFRNEQLEKELGLTQELACAKKL